MTIRFSGRVRRLPAGSIVPGALVELASAVGSIAPEAAWLGSYEERDAFEKRVTMIGGRSRTLAEQLAREEMEAVNRLTTDNDRRTAAGETAADPWLDLICRTKQRQADLPGMDFHKAYDWAVIEQEG